MARHFRAQVRLSDTTNPAARDRCVNVLHFRDNGINPTDEDALATDLAAIYAGFAYFGDTNQVAVNLYDLADAEPRPVVGSATHSYVKTDAGPREVALCLSFYADRNIPRRRGRIYVGPFNAGRVDGRRPSQALLDGILALAPAFSSLGGADIDWVLYSPTESQGAGATTVHQITHAWVDNEWDTIRSRGLRADTRVQSDVSG
jgi:hypothetical protein